MSRCRDTMKMTKKEHQEWRDYTVNFILGQFPRMSRDLVSKVNDAKLINLKYEALAQSDKGY